MSRRAEPLEAGQREADAEQRDAERAGAEHAPERRAPSDWPIGPVIGNGQQRQADEEAERPAR